MTYQLTSAETLDLWEAERRRTGSVYGAEQAVKKAQQQAAAGDPAGAAARAERARALITKAHQGIAALALAHLQERAAGEKRPVSHYNPDGHLSGHGVGEARRADLAAIAARDRAKLDAFQTEIEQATRILLDVAGADPKPTADDLARRAAHWRRAESLLNIGRLPSQVVRDATDADELLALRDELPTYLRVQYAQTAAGDERAAREAAQQVEQIDARLAELGDPQALARMGLADRTRVEGTTATAVHVIQRGNAGLSGTYALQVVASGATR